MSRHHSHITSAVKVIESAVAGEPLLHHLKKFFAADKKYGSKDRKAISSLCYNYYRIGDALKEKNAEKRMIAATFLCSDAKSDLLEQIAPELNEKAGLSKEQKLAFLKIHPGVIFPFSDELSAGIDKEAFIISFLKQPLLFLRIRPGKQVKLLEKLTEEKIAFEEISTSCIALPPASKLDDIVKLNKDAVVQDLNSQQVFNYLQQDGVFLSKDAAVWDCCAASGGKSILLYDLLHGYIDLDVSDIREHILKNLQNRFKDAGIKKYHSFVADLTAKDYSPSSKKYELIVCDAPCTGSGTWARSPEQVAFFDAQMIDNYVAMQQRIAAAAVQSLKAGGMFIYITCSVFEKENEAMVEYLKKSCKLHLLDMQYLKGYSDRADSMFTAVFSK